MKQYWLIAFVIVLVIHLVGIQVQHEWLDCITKPLLVPLVAGYYLSAVKKINTPLKRWILLALFFSWVGDILLIYQAKDELYFLAGLGSFLIAHLFYIVFFHKVRVREGVKSNWAFALVVAVYYAVLIIWLSPYLGDKKLPVRIYGVVISFMLMLALHMLFIMQKQAGKWMMIGALLFVISDSILAINKFYQPFGFAGLLIMLTYGAAQFSIAKGAADYSQVTRS